jgi:N-acetylglutamate synthase-like GNAT family acetyltransferase
MNDDIKQNPITIRHTLKPGDVGMITLLHGTLYAEEYGLSPEFEGYVAAGIGKFAQSHDENLERLWIAEMNGQIVGSIAIIKHDEAVAQLRWFLIHPQARGHGLGRRLISEALAFCSRRHYKSVFLLTLHNLYAAGHLYQANGFIKSAEQTHFIWGHTLTEERYDLTLE